MVWCFLISELDADMEKMDKEAGNSFCAFENVRDVVKLFFLSWWDGVYSKSNSLWSNKNDSGIW